LATSFSLGFVAHYRPFGSLIENFESTPEKDPLRVIPVIARLLDELGWK
jgi:hypothetical protein